MSWHYSCRMFKKNKDRPKQEPGETGVLDNRNSDNEDSTCNCLIINTDILNRA